ncbi:MAG: hypothetical protein LC723_07870, partial [Actinobacteria bacterium]|nr:hypothetical protein [Actinomycetota bacterium]
VGGFAPHAVTFIRSDKASIDLHRALPLVRSSPDACWAALQRLTQEVRVAGVSVRAFSPPAQAFQLAVHIVQHPGIEKNRRELALAIANITLADWRMAGDLAHTIQGEDAFAEGLSKSSEGLVILNALGIEPPKTNTIVAAAGVQGFRWLGKQVEGTSSLRERAALFGRLLVPRPDFMRQVSRLARANAVGLVLAYLLRPFVLAYRLGLAVRHLFGTRADTPAE